MNITDFDSVSGEGNALDALEPSKVIGAIKDKTMTPLGTSVAGAALGAATGYIAAPVVQKLLGPVIRNTMSSESYENFRRNLPALRRRLAVAGFALGGATPIALNYNPGMPGYGLLNKYSSSVQPLPKKADAFNDVMSGEAIPMSSAAYYIQNDPSMSPVVKEQALQSLNAIANYPSQKVDGGDILMGAVRIGLPLLTGAAIGYVVSRATGMASGPTGMILGATINGLGKLI